MSDIQDKFRELDFCLISLEARLSEIHSVADIARKRHSVQGHQCELRKAIDSIFDRTVEDLRNARDCAKFYNSFEHAEMERLRKELMSKRTMGLMLRFRLWLARVFKEEV